MGGLVTFCALSFDPVAILKGFRAPDLVMRELGCQLSINHAENALFRRSRVRYDSCEVGEAFGQDGDDFAPQVRLCEELRVFEDTQLRPSIVTIKRICRHDAHDQGRTVVWLLLANELLLPTVTI